PQGDPRLLCMGRVVNCLISIRKLSSLQSSCRLCSGGLHALFTHSLVPGICAQNDVFLATRLIATGYVANECYRGVGRHLRGQGRPYHRCTGPCRPVSPRPPPIGAAGESRCSASKIRLRVTTTSCSRRSIRKS